MKAAFYYLLFFMLMSTLSLLGQTQKQSDTSNRFTPLFQLKKGYLLQNIDVIANMQFSWDQNFIDGKYTGSRLALNQFRFEMKGLVHPKVYYRFRYRYTRATEVQSLDNLQRAVDFAFIRIALSKKWSLTVGKQGTNWGGFEFDLNPIEIYEYNDILQNSDNFLGGIEVSWKALPKHEFAFQVLNSRTQTFSEIYDSIPGISPTKLPAAIIGNWRGSFWDGKFNTLYSYGTLIDAKSQSTHYIAMGNQINLKKWKINYDFKWSNEDIDRKNIISSFIPNSYTPFRALKVRYVEHWVQVQRNIGPKWNAALIGMVSQAFWFGNPDVNKNDLLRTSWGIVPSIEYYPFKKINLRFFGTYVWRLYNYSPYSTEKFATIDYNSSRVMIGFISPLLIL